MNNILLSNLYGGEATKHAAGYHWLSDDPTNLTWPDYDRRSQY